MWTLEFFEFFLLHLLSSCGPNPIFLGSFSFFVKYFLFNAQQYLSSLLMVGKVMIITNWIQCEHVPSSCETLDVVALVGRCSFDMTFSWSFYFMVWNEREIFYSYITWVISTKFSILFVHLFVTHPFSIFLVHFVSFIILVDEFSFVP